jgi:hypothetical protein
MPTFGSTGPYQIPSMRQFHMTINTSVDLGNLPTLPERMDLYLKEALRWHLKDAAEGIIKDATNRMRDLPHPKGAIKGPHVDLPGGYDTGKLAGTLEPHLVEALMSTGVFYDLLSEEAEYWEYVEFGHWVAAKAGDWFWPGYHLLEQSVMRNIPKIRRACRMAWSDAMIKLGAEARVPTPGIHAGGTSPLLHR